MNNQQAINLLKGLEKNLDDYCGLNDEGKTAFGMAIKALELFGNSEQLPPAEPDTTTHDSIPAEIGKNDSDRTSGDCISRQQAFKAVEKNACNTQRIMDAINNLPSAQPEIIRCKDCIYQTESWIGIKYCEAHGDHIGKDYDYCSNARRKENG